MQGGLREDGLQTLPARVVEAASRFWDVVGPGGQLHPEAFLASKGHLLIEGVLGMVLLGMLCARSAPSSRKQLKPDLTEQVGRPCRAGKLFAAALCLSNAACRGQ